MFALRIARTCPSISLTKELPMSSLPLKIGDNVAQRFEGTQLSRLTKEREAQHFSPAQELSKKTVILFSVPGAFTTVCTDHLHQLAQKVEAFQKLDASVYCISADNRDVVHAWATAHDENHPNTPSAHQIQFIPDYNRKLVELAGLPVHLGPPRDLGTVWPRAVFTIMDGIIRDVQQEVELKDLKVTHPDHVLKRLDTYKSQINKHADTIKEHTDLYPQYERLQLRVYNNTNNTDFASTYSLEELPELSEKVDGLKRELARLKGEEEAFKEKALQYKDLYIQKKREKERGLITHLYGPGATWNFQELEKTLNTESETIENIIQTEPGLLRNMRQLGLDSGAIKPRLMFGV